MELSIDYPPAEWPGVFHEWTKAVFAEDLERFHDLLTEDVVIAQADGSSLTGPQAWIGLLGWFYGLLGLGGQSTEQWFAEPPNTYGWRWRHVGTASNGASFDLSGCTICRFNGERVSHIASYVDTAQLVRIASPQATS